MMHQATLAYDKTLMRRAAFAFVWHTCGLAFLITVVLITISLAWLLALGDRSWHIGCLATSLVFALATVAALYFSHYQNGMTKLRDMGMPLVGLIVEDSSFSITTGTARTTLRWSTVTAVWRFPGFWLMCFSKLQFFTVPIASLSPEMRTFMLLRVRASGGKVMDEQAACVTKPSPPN